MTYAANPAKNLGISMEETAAAIGVLSDNSLGGERAGTALRAIFSQLVSPTDKAKKALADYNLTAADVNPELRSLGDIITTLADANLSLADANELVGLEAGGALLALAGSAEKYDTYTGKLRAAEGAAGDMAATMRDQLNGAIQSFGSSIEGLIIALGDAGLTDVLRSVIDTGTEFVRILTGMENLGEIAAIAGTAAVALGALIFPFAAVGVAAAAAAVWITANWEELRDRFPRVFAVLERGAEIVRTAFGAVRNAVGVAADWIGAKAQAIGAALAPAVDLMRAQADRVVGVIGAAWRGDWAAAWDGAKEIATDGIDGLRTAFAALRDFEMPEIDLSGLIPEEIAGLPAVEKLTTALGAARDVLVDLADKAGSAVSTIFDGALASFSERMEPISAAADRFSDALGPLGGALSDLGAALAKLFSGSEGSDETADRLTAIGSAIGRIAAVLTEGLLSLLTGMAKGVTALVEGVTAALEGDWETAWDLAASAPQALLDEMAGLWSSIKPVLEDLWRDVKAAVAGWPDDLKKVGGDIVAGLADGIRDKIKDAKDAIASLGQLLPEWMRREVDSNSPSRVFMAIGHDITDGLAIGIAERGKAAEAAAVGVANDVLNGARNALEIRSPSRKTHKIGVQTVDGMIGGIADQTDALVRQIEDTANAASNTFETGIRSAVDYMVRGFEDGLSGLKDILKRTLIDMATTAATNKIMIGLGFGGSGMGAMGGGIASGAGGMFGGLGSTLGGLGTAFMGGASSFLSTGFAGLGTTLAGATGSLAGFAAAAGAIALPVAAAVAAFDFFRQKTKKLDQGVRLTTEGMATSVEQWDRIRKTRFWGLSTDTDNYYRDANKSLANPMERAVASIQTGIVEAADALGVGSRAFAGFSHEIRLSTKGMSEDEATKALQDELSGLGNAFARMVPGVSGLRREGESAADALTRTATTLASVNTAFGNLGLNDIARSLEGGKIANRLVEMSGGLQQFATATQFYFDNIMSAPDRLKSLTKQFMDGLAAANINWMPSSNAAYQGQVERWSDAGRSDKAQTLINLAPLFTQIQQLQSELDATGASASGATDGLAEQQRRAAEVARERAGLETQLLRAQGNTAAIRRAELAALDPSNRALQTRIWWIEDETAKLAEQKAQWQEARGLWVQLRTLQGDTAAVRRMELEALNPANQALQKRIWWLQDEQEKLQARAQLWQEQRGLWMQIRELEGDTVAVRRMELEAMDPALHALQKRVYALQDAAAAEERAAAIAEEGLGIQRQIWNLTGNTAAIQRDLLASLDPANRALQKQVFALEKQAEAAERASAVADERTSLEDRLLQLQGNTAELRRRELAGLDASNRSLQLMIYGLEDAAQAMEDLDPAAFATKLDFERARARAVSGVGGVTSTGVPLAVVPSVGPQSVESATIDELRAIRKELADLRTQNRQLQSNGNADLRKLRTIEERREATAEGSHP
jgi:hypothetical protein